MNFEEDKYTTFNPIYEYTSIHPEKTVTEYTKQISYNEYEFIDNSGNKKCGFKKFISLVDFVKFLIGKYKSEQINILPSLELEENGNLYRKYIKSHNNYAYVDAFYYYLTNSLKKKGFVHGIDVYDSYLCIKKNVEINIAEDFEYVVDSNYFNEKLNKLFYFKDENISSMFRKDDFKLKELNISDIEESIDTLNIEELEELEDNKNQDLPVDVNSLEDNTDDTTENNIKNIEQTDDIEVEELMVEENNSTDEDDEDEEDNDSEISVTDEESEELDENKDSSDSTNSSDYETTDDEIIEELEKLKYQEENDENKSSNESDESDESNDDKSSDDSTDTKNSNSQSDQSESDDETNSFDDSDEDEMNDLILIIKEMPTQVVFIEKCDNTFDSLLENNIRIEELESAIFQVIVILYTYQKIYQFTHNDLHTNNIMYIHTDVPYLYYKIMGQTYKIPTFGKIYKIIDFGRAIYTVNDKLICSDSFSVNGTAHTQYNFEPFYNPNKPILTPNYSFDLCRLACSMLDFIIDDLNDIDTFKTVPIYNLIISWIYDDSGTNILYKRNGEERYPDFKLYRMIARIVHNHLPEKQFSHECFEKFKIEHIDTENNMMNIDEY